MGKLEDYLYMIKRMMVIIKKLSPSHKILKQAAHLIDGTGDVMRADNLDNTYLIQTGVGYKIAKDIDGIQHTYFNGGWSTNEAQLFDTLKEPEPKRDYIDVYDWLDDVFGIGDITDDEVAARVYIELMLLPACKQFLYAPITDRMVVFCACEGKVYRCTGASTLGSIYLHENLDATGGYSRCVLPEECSDWRFTFIDPVQKTEQHLGNVVML